MATENEKRRKSELHKIVNLDFLNEINQNNEIDNAKRKPYIINKKTKKEIEEGIKFQIKFYNNKIATLKKQLKKLKK